MHGGTGPVPMDEPQEHLECGVLTAGPTLRSLEQVSGVGRKHLHVSRPLVCEQGLGAWWAVNDNAPTRCTPDPHHSCWRRCNCR